MQAGEYLLFSEYLFLLGFHNAFVFGILRGCKKMNLLQMCSSLLYKMSIQQNQKNLKVKIIGGYRLGKKIGKGTFAIVKQGIHIRSGQKVAVKILHKKLIIDARDKINLSRQLQILQKIRHPHLVQLYEILENKSKIYLIMEHVEGGQLYEKIVGSSKNRLEQSEASKIFQQMLTTLEYLQALGIAHRDLKPENILITKDINIKIIDFGLSNFYQPKQLLSTACGSPCYAAPEMISNKSYDPFKADLWSCGVVVYTMLCGFLPYEHENTSELYRLIQQGQYQQPEHLSTDAKSIIKMMIQVQPTKRPSIMAIRNHPFCQKQKQPIYKGLFPNEKIEIDSDIIDKMDEIGYKGFKKDIQNCKMNEGTAAFYILLTKSLRQKGVNFPIYYRESMKKNQPFRSKSFNIKHIPSKNPEQLPIIKRKEGKQHEQVLLRKQRYHQSEVNIAGFRHSSPVIKAPLRISRPTY